MTDLSFDPVGPGSSLLERRPGEPAANRRPEALAGPPSVQAQRVAAPGEAPSGQVIIRPLDVGAAVRAQETEQSSSAPAVSAGPRPPEAAFAQTGVSPPAGEPNETPDNIFRQGADNATPGPETRPTVDQLPGIIPETPRTAQQDRFDPTPTITRPENPVSLGQDRAQLVPTPNSQGFEDIQSTPQERAVPREVGEPLGNTGLGEGIAEFRRTDDLIRPAGTPRDLDVPDTLADEAVARRAERDAAINAPITTGEREDQLRADQLARAAESEALVGLSETARPLAGGASGAEAAGAAAPPALTREQLFPAQADDATPPSAVLDTPTALEALREPAAAPNLLGVPASPIADLDPSESFSPFDTTGRVGETLNEANLRAPQAGQFPESADPVEIAIAPPDSADAAPATPFPEGVDPFGRQQRPAREVSPAGEPAPQEGSNAGPASTSQAEPGPQFVAPENETLSDATVLPVPPEPDRRPDLNRAGVEPGEPRPAIQPEDRGTPVVEEPGVERDNAFADLDIRRGVDLDDPRDLGGPDTALAAAQDSTRSFADLDQEGRIASTDAGALLAGTGIAENTPFVATTDGPRDDVTEDRLTEDARATRQEGPGQIDRDLALDELEPFPPGSDPDELRVIAESEDDVEAAAAPAFADARIAGAAPDPDTLSTAGPATTTGQAAPTEDPGPDLTSSDIVEQNAPIAVEPGPRPEEIRLARDGADPAEFEPAQLATLDEPEPALRPEAATQEPEPRTGDRGDVGSIATTANIDDGFAAQAAAAASQAERALPQPSLNTADAGAADASRPQPVNPPEDAARLGPETERQQRNTETDQAQRRENTIAAAELGAPGSPIDFAPDAGQPVFAFQEVASSAPLFSGPPDPGGLSDFGSRFSQLSENIRLASFSVVDRGVNLDGIV